MMADTPDLHVADLGAVTSIVGGLANAPREKSEDGEKTRYNPQSNVKEPRQFGNSQPSNGPEGSTGEPTGMAAGQDAMTMGSGDAGV